MSLKKTLAGVAPFAHLLSRAGAARAEQEDDERKQRDDESDEDYAKRMEELDDKEKAEEEKRKEEEAKNAKANDVDGDDTEAEDGDDETDDSKKAARATERARCARIMAHGVATGNVEQAAKFAFNTKMSSADAIAILGSGAHTAAPAAPVASQRKSLDERMAHARPRNPGDSAPAAAEPTMAERIIAAGKLRRGEL
ncbi:hypothetical protein [Caballeronia sp. LZ028]|uniref:hypothetical protein n=1 Tax=Caballeronia sp. LZ028 TaxID=3038563 RepID=UPI0020293C66|nr:hypothetical protein [Caballeronia sp. LZ028]MDR5765033.1 hypothetical protein [Caballeronia sp. LZ028]